MTPMTPPTDGLLDLDAEICASQAAVTPKHKAMLLRAGVAPDAFLWGWAGVTTALINGTCWTPYDGGDEVVVVPVFCADERSPEWPDPAAAIRFGELVDAIAFRLEQPDKWALRCGVAQWLGAIEPQVMTPEPVMVHRTPLDWLRAGGQGIVPLSRSPRDVQRLLLPCRAITVSDIGHGKFLRRVMSRPFVIPEIYVETHARKSAA